MEVNSSINFQAIYKALSDGPSIPDWLTAIGTLLLAFLAVFGDWLKNQIFRPRAKIVELNATGTRTYFAYQTGPNTTVRGPDVIFFHLIVMSLGKFFHSPVPLVNCRVILTAISVASLEGGFRRIVLAVPVQFKWAPAETTPAQINISRLHTLDFGMLVGPHGNQGPRFVPALFVIPFNFEGELLKAGTILYEIHVEADNYRDRNSTIVEVTWSGEWIPEGGDVSSQISVRIVKGN